MIDPESLCWLCKKPECDSESEVVTVKELSDPESGFVRVRTEYYHRECLKEYHKRFISLHEYRKIKARRKQALEEFQKNRGEE